MFHNFYIYIILHATCSFDEDEQSSESALPYKEGNLQPIDKVYSNASGANYNKQTTTTTGSFGGGRSCNEKMVPMENEENLDILGVWFILFEDL